MYNIYFINLGVNLPIIRYIFLNMKIHKINYIFSYNNYLI